MSGEGGKKPFWGLLPLCLLGVCPHRTAEDDTGIWGECVICGQRAGFVSRDDLRRYIDRETANKVSP